MSKKKRSNAAGGVANASAAGAGSGHGASGSGASGGNASTATHGEADDQEVMYSLQELSQHYHTLAVNVTTYTLRFDRFLWLHNLVALVLQNVLMYDTDVMSDQLALLLWTALWVGRSFLIHGNSPVITGTNGSLRYWLLWRGGISAVCLGALLPFMMVQMHEFSMGMMQMIVAMATLEIYALALLSKSKGQLTFGIICATTIERVFAIRVFSTQLNYKDFLIFDRTAFDLVSVTIIIHNILLQSTKLVLCQSEHESVPQQNRQRGVRLLETIRDKIESVEVAEVTPSTPTNKQRKKKAEKLKQAKSNAIKLGINDMLQTPAQEPSAAMAMFHKLCQRGWALFDRTRVRVATMLLVQSLLVIVQVGMSFAVLSFEATSFLMLSSAHVLYLILQLREELIQEIPLKGVATEVAIDAPQSETAAATAAQ